MDLLYIGTGDCGAQNGFIVVLQTVGPGRVKLLEIQVVYFIVFEDPDCIADMVSVHMRQDHKLKSIHTVLVQKSPGGGSVGVTGVYETESLSPGGVHIFQKDAESAAPGEGGGHVHGGPVILFRLGIRDSNCNRSLYRLCECAENKAENHQKNSKRSCCRQSSLTTFVMVIGRGYCKKTLHE